MAARRKADTIPVRNQFALLPGSQLKREFAESSCVLFIVIPRLIVTRNSCSSYRQNRAHTSFNYQVARRIPRKKIRGPSPSDNRILARGSVALRDNSQDEGLKGK